MAKGCVSYSCHLCFYIDGFGEIVEFGELGRYEEKRSAASRDNFRILLSG